MKLRDKIHNYLQEKALDKAILDTMGDIGEYYFDNEKLRVLVKESKLNKFNSLCFNLPCWDEINKKAIKYYNRFNIKNVKKVKYFFQHLRIEKNINITAKDSDIYLGNNNFTDIKINDADNVEIYGDPIEDGGISINANNIQISKFDGHVSGEFNITSSCLEFDNINLLFANKIILNSDMIEFRNTYLFSNNMNLKSNLIVTENSRLSAVRRINIIDTNCDEIKGVEAPVIIYNGQDISYSEDIVMPKLRINLIEILKKAKNKINAEIDNEIKKETKILKEELNNKPITRILKK